MIDAVIVDAVRTASGKGKMGGALSGTHRLLTGGMAALLAMSIAGCYGEDQAVTQPAPVPTTTAPSTMQGSPVPTPPPAQPVRMGDFAEPPAVLKGKVAAVPPTMGEACVKPAPPVAPAPPAPQNAVAVPRQDR